MNKKNIRQGDINKQRPRTINWRPQNGVLNELCSTFREVRFDESKFLAGTPVLDTQYEHSWSQNNNPLYLFNDQLDYALVHYFAESKTNKNHVDRFFTNPMIKPNTKKLSYCNTDKWMKKLSNIL